MYIGHYMQRTYVMSKPKNRHVISDRFTHYSSRVHLKKSLPELRLT